MPQQIGRQARLQTHNIMLPGKQFLCQNASLITQQKIQFPLPRLFLRIKLKASSQIFPHPNVMQTPFYIATVINTAAGSEGLGDRQHS